MSEIRDFNLYFISKTTGSFMAQLTFNINPSNNRKMILCEYSGTIVKSPLLESPVSASQCIETVYLLCRWTQILFARHHRASVSSAGWSKRSCKKSRTKCILNGNGKQMRNTRPWGIWSFIHIQESYRICPAISVSAENIHLVKDKEQSAMKTSRGRCGGGRTRNIGPF